MRAVGLAPRGSAPARRRSGFRQRRPRSPGDVRISVVIPTRNEAKNLPHVLKRIPADVHEVLIVDGLSKDRTVEVARAERPDVRIVTQVVPGKGAALRSGFYEASGDVIVALDGRSRKEKEV